MSECALTVSGITKRFGGLVASDDISIELPRGARRALIGPNGAGKTTLIGILSGALKPDAGSIAVFGEDITRISAASRVKSGLVRTFQVSSLFAKLSVLDNVFLASSEHSGSSRRFWNPAWRCKNQIDKASQIIERLGLADDMHRPVAEIAYGRQRLVEIAIALSLEARVLLLDEPAAGIPTAEIEMLLEVIDALPREMTILLIEHDMDIVRRFADQVTVMVQGKVLLTGSPCDVMESPVVQSVYLGTTGRDRFKSELQRA
jgi:branched-chain amino acid transport system ATP-binding protein